MRISPIDWEAFFREIDAGKTMRQVCLMPGMPSYGYAWARWKKDPEFQRRIKLTPRKHWERVTDIEQTLRRVLDLIGEGYTIKEVAAIDDLPTEHTIYAFMKKYAWFRREYDQVRAGRECNRDRTRRLAAERAEEDAIIARAEASRSKLCSIKQMLAQAVERIENGASLTSMDVSPDMPSVGTFYNYAKKYPWFRSRLAAALKRKDEVLARQRAEGRRLALVADFSGWMVRIRKGESLQNILKGTALHAMSFRAVVATDQRLEREYYLAKRWHRCATRPAKAKPAVRVYAVDNLSSALRQNEVYARAIKAVPRNIDDREDICTDIVVAVLAGQIAVNEIEKRATDFIKAHRKVFRRFEFSLDQKLIDDGEETFLDRVTTHEWTNEAFA